MKRAAVFFDRDNTLIANDGYLGDPKGVVLVDGAAEAVARARALGFAVVVFSNQSGVARGMFSEEAVHAVNQRLDEMLLDENPQAVIDRHEFCPYHPQASVDRYRQDSDLRKPKPGMILQAERQLALDLGRSWVVGDAPRDIDAGRAVGCRTILVSHTSLPASPASWEQGQGKPDFEVRSLHEALDVIERSVNGAASSNVGEGTGPELSAADLEDDGSTSQAGGMSQAEGMRSEDSMDAGARSAVEDRSGAPARSFGARAFEQARAGAAEPVATAAAEEPQDAAEPEARSRADDGPRPRRVIPAEPETSLRSASPGPGSTLKPKPRSEVLLEQILDELRRRHEQHPDADFSVSKMMAGVVQIIALAALFLALFWRDTPNTYGLWITIAIFLQVFTIALLIMGRQK